MDTRDPDQPAARKRLHADFRRNMHDFLRAELAMSFTLARSAETEHQSGELRHAQHTLTLAEKGCGTVQRFLADPKYNKHLNPEEQRQLGGELVKLEALLERLHGMQSTAPSPPPPRRRK
jgi:hypothetical protein